jgi:hypothetical protein
MLTNFPRYFLTTYYLTHNLIQMALLLAGFVTAAVGLFYVFAWGVHFRKLYKRLSTVALLSREDWDRLNHRLTQANNLGEEALRQTAAHEESIQTYGKLINEGIPVAKQALGSVQATIVEIQKLLLRHEERLNGGDNLATTFVVSNAFDEIREEMRVLAETMDTRVHTVELIADEMLSGVSAGPTEAPAVPPNGRHVAKKTKKHHARR